MSDSIQSLYQLWNSITKLYEILIPPFSVLTNYESYLQVENGGWFFGGPVTTRKRTVSGYELRDILELV